MIMAFFLTLGSNVLPRVQKHFMKMKSVKAPANQVRKAGGHNCHDLAGATPRLRESNESQPRSGGRREGELTADCVLQPLALGCTPKARSGFPWQLIIPSQDAGGNIVIPGVAFTASVIISVGARNQLNVTAQLPGSSDARRGLRSSLSFISCVGKKSLIPDWVPLESNSCGL